jgi:hypothetical protein
MVGIQLHTLVIRAGSCLRAAVSMLAVLRPTLPSQVDKHTSLATCVPSISSHHMFCI